MISDERTRVEEHSRIGNYAEGVNTRTTGYCGALFMKYMKQGSVLEMGPAEGVMTDVLFPHFEDYTVVDGADFFVQAISSRYPSIKGQVSLFEDFVPGRRFDNIVLGHVLEHVIDPVEILKKCAGWLERGGVCLAAVPNSRSIHRQAAVHMGLLTDEKQLNSTDIRNGHRRVYDIEMLQKDFEESGLRVVAKGGYWLKPESNAQINANWNDSMIDAFLALGEKYPDIAGEIYIVGSI